MSLGTCPERGLWDPTLFTLLWHGHEVNSFVPYLSLDQHKEILQLWDGPSTTVRPNKTSVLASELLQVWYKSDGRIDYNSQRPSCCTNRCYTTYSILLKKNCTVAPHSSGTWLFGKCVCWGQGQYKRNTLRWSFVQLNQIPEKSKGEQRVRF